MASKYGIDIEVNPNGAVSGSRTAKRSLEDVEKAADKAQGSVAGVAGALGGMALEAAAGVASVAALAAAVRTSIQANRQFEKSLSDLSAITGATGGQLAYLSAQAQQIGATTSLSASEAAEAFKLIASAKPDLLESSSALNEVTRAAVTLAEAAGTSLPDAANTLGSALNQFGAGAEEAARFINVLAAGAKFGAAEVEQVAESLKNAGVSAASAGVSFEEANAAIQALAAVSIKGGEAGTALRNIILKLETDVDQKLRPSVEGLSGALEELAKRNEDTAALTKRFGLENINAAQALLTNVENVKELTGQLTGTNTALEQAATRTNNLDGDFKQLSSATEALSLAIGDRLNPAAREGVKFLTDLANAAALAVDAMGKAPTTVDGVALRLANVNEQIKDLEESQKGFTGSLNSLFGGAGFRTDQLAALREEAKRLQEQYEKLQGISPTAAQPPRNIATLGAKPPQAAIPAAIPTTSAEGQKALESLKQQAELAKLTGEARARLAAIQKLGASATKEEKEEAAKLAAEIYKLDEARKSEKKTASSSATEKARLAKENKTEIADLEKKLELTKLSDIGYEKTALTVADVTSSMAKASLAAKTLAQRQAELSLNQYATPAQVQQVRDLAAALSDLEAKKKAEQEFAQLSQQLEDPIAKLERERAERLAIIQTYEQLETDSHAQAEAMRAETERQYKEQRLAAMEEMYRQQSWGNELVMDSIDALGAASTNVISGLLSGTMSVKDAMQQFANIILNSVVGAFVDLGVEYIKNQVLASTAQSAQLAMAAATGPAIAAAYAPAAAMTSLASFGANAAPATAGIASTVAASSALALAGFKDGGWTGNMGTSQVAGVVHGQEYVMNAEATRRIGVGNLERMSSGGSMGGVNITVENNVAGARASVQQLSDTDVRIIINEELNEQFPQRMTAEMANPYSDSRAVLSSSYSIQRNTVR